MYEIPKTVQRLIDLAHKYFDGDMLAIIKTYKIWPAIQMKKIPGNDGLIMLYNTYTRVGVEHFAELYNQCRSVIIHMPTAHIVASSKPIPTRVSIKDVPVDIQNADVCYEGTNILVYNHFNKWYFSTTACPSMDYSFFVKGTSHGSMFDEALNMINMDRNALINKLDPQKSYSFTLVHYKNTRYTNYDAEFGPEYKKLVYSGPDALDIPGIVIAQSFNDNESIIQYLENNPHAFGVVMNGSIKITNDTIKKREEVNAGWDNIWYNIINVYMLKRDDYNIADYIREYGEDTAIDPVEAEELIKNVFNALGDKIWDYYKMTTNYTPGATRYTMTPAQNAVDKSLGQTMRFQLAQLRVLQTHNHRHEYLTREFIDTYLVSYRLVREIVKLIKHLASYAIFQNNPYNFTAEENTAIIQLGNYVNGNRPFIKEID